MTEYMLKSNIREEIGMLDRINPELHAAWNAYHDSVFDDGALSRKTKMLIGVAGAHITRCPYCIRAKVTGAKQAGATDAEIVEAIYVGMRFAMGAPFAYSSIAFETYDALEKGQNITEGHFFSKNIAKEIGQFREASGRLTETFMAFHKKVFEDGALSKKLKRAVIGLAAAHMTRCPWCIRGCVKDAVEFGVSRQEVAEAINVAMVMAAGACYAHTGVSMETLHRLGHHSAPAAAAAGSASSSSEDTSDIECGC